MRKEELYEYMDIFREKAESNKLVIFVGAGVSKNVKGMPSWYELVKKMADEIGYSKCDYCRYKNNCDKNECKLKYDYSNEEFLKIPQYLYNSDKNKYNAILQESILVKEKIDAPMSSAIFEINPAHIITTNYDKLLEDSSNVYCQQYEIIIRDRDLLNAEKNKYIIKMHGDINDINNIVLKESDYLDYSQNHVLIELFVKSLLADHTLIFLGYSLNDYNIKLIINWINYMRIQNEVIDKNKKIGYIILDEENIDNIQQSYYESNNISVVNINQMTFIDNIDKSITEEKGKRLYSFLKVISNPNLDTTRNLEPIENKILFMSEYPFLDYKQIMQILNINNYEKIGEEIRLHNELDYEKLESIINGNNDDISKKLKQLFVNSGVVLLSIGVNLEVKHINIGKLSDSTLLQDNLYNLYIQNDYVNLKKLLDNENDNLVKKYFYKSIIEGYSNVKDEYKNIDFKNLSLNKKVSYLHNNEVLNIYRGINFQFKNVINFIENLSLEKERNLFSNFLDIYKGNVKKLNDINKNIDNIKNNESKIICGIQNKELLEIRNIVLSEYLFYFYNNVFCDKMFTEVKSIFERYIEAVMLTQKEKNIKEVEILGITFQSKEKYPLYFIDLDIITKYINTKYLVTLVDKFKIISLNINEKEINFLITCFRNICLSMNNKIYGNRSSLFVTFANLSLVLSLIPLNDENKREIEKSLKLILHNDEFDKIFFSIACSDFKYSIIALSRLSKHIKIDTNIDIIRKIVNNNSFFEFAINIDFSLLQNIFNSLLDVSINKNNITQDELDNIIETQNEINKKIILLRLLYKYIGNDNIKNKYKKLLSENFMELTTYDIYDFVFNDWIDISKEIEDRYLQHILELENNNIKGVQVYPDPLKSALECVYILYINNKIKDISLLRNLKTDEPHLCFLLSPETFDYSKVDFSNYMWRNFATKKKYMDKFIEHKSEIITSLKKKIINNTATDDEKIIYYRYFVDEDEVWRL